MPSSTTTTVGETGETGDSTPTGGDTSDSTPTGDPTEDPTGEPMDGPHALASIILGESHPAAGGNTLPFVSASFVPDVDGAGGGACTASVAGCQIALVPDCNNNCDASQYCGFDAACQATCQEICDASCGPDEVCYFPAANTPGCKKLETFDGGALSFIGTPIPITLFPPYAFMSDVNASPFAPGSAAKIQASGASGAGFEKFEKEFTGTDFMQTSPKLSTLGFADVFGNGPLPVKWTPGNGQVTITATVQSVDYKFGTITCKADDASGSFDVPREALKAAIEDGDIANLTLSIQRQRTDVYKDLSTTGQLTGVNVQPVGHLHIITSSTESHTFQGCPQGEAACNNECVDVEFDPKHCGGCNKPCGVDQTCEYGTCFDGEACEPGAVLCNDACVDVEFDPDHCGGCNEACGFDQTCGNGICLGGGGCPQGEVECDDACIDVESDPNHCGDCFNACGAGEVCNGGACLDVCKACEKTAATGICKAEHAACAADAECNAFEICRDICDTQLCVLDECVPLLLEDSDYELYDAQAACVCEEACANECDQLCE